MGTARAFAFMISRPCDRSTDARIDHEADERAVAEADVRKSSQLRQVPLYRLEAPRVAIPLRARQVVVQGRSKVASPLIGAEGSPVRAPRALLAP
jgi:hypothetical protein